MRISDHSLYPHTLNETKQQFNISPDVCCSCVSSRRSDQTYSQRRPADTQSWALLLALRRAIILYLQIVDECFLIVLNWNGPSGGWAGHPTRGPSVPPVLVLEAWPWSSTSQNIRIHSSWVFVWTRFVVLMADLWRTSVASGASLAEPGSRSHSSELPLSSLLGRQVKFICWWCFEVRLRKSFKLNVRLGGSEDWPSQPVVSFT